MKDKVPPLLRRGQDILVLDQLELPHRILYRRCRTPAEVAGAIRRMILRGAPLIGCSAAYGYAFAARTERKDTPRRLEGAAGCPCAPSGRSARTPRGASKGPPGSSWRAGRPR